MEITLTTNARAFIRDLRRLRRKAISFAYKRTLDDGAFVAAREIERDYKRRYSPKTPRGRRMMNAPRRPTRPTGASDRKAAGGLLGVSRSFVTPAGRITRPSRLANRGSNAMVKTMLRGGVRRSADGGYMAVPKTGRRVRKGGKKFSVAAPRGNRLLFRPRRHARAEFVATLTKAARVKGRLVGAERRALRRAARALPRIFERHLRRELRAFRARTKPTR